MIIDELKIEGIDFKNADIGEREKYAKEEKINEIISFLQSNGIRDIVPLITCGRTEFIYFSKKFADIDERFYKLSSFSAFEHLLRLSVGVDSMVFGETHIIHQIKSAFLNAIDNGMCSRDKIWVLNFLIFITRKIRSKVDLNRKDFGDFIVEISKSIFENPYAKEVLLIGTGEMADLISKKLKFFKAVCVFSRSFERAKEFSEKIKSYGVRAFPIGEVDIRKNIIVSATDYNIRITKKEVEKSGGFPKLIVDISVPRVFEEEIKKLPLTFLYYVDDIGKMSREVEIDVSKYIEEEMEIFKDKVEKIKRLKDLSRIKEVFERKIKEEIETYFPNNGFSDEIAKRLAKKLLSPFFEIAKII